MAVNLPELLALPPEERLRLAEALWSSVVPADLALLAAEFVERADRVNCALDGTIGRLDRLDEILAHDRAEAREAVLRAGEQWPFDYVPAAK